MKLNKILIFGTIALGLGATSCVGDLNLDPIDPNLYTDTESPDFYKQALGECYSIMAVSGQQGPGSSIISGLDNGRGQYTRAIFMMNEFTTDECLWVWKDDGIYDLVTCTFGASNGNIYGTYGRLYAHIAVCNQFINSIPEDTPDAEMLEMRNEARALRAMSYYWALDIFGNPSFTLDSPDGINEPGQIKRNDLYKWLEEELIFLVDESNLSSSPLYGRVGKDGAEALLARLYLNAGVYTGTTQWSKCAERCQNIIERHEGQSVYGGLTESYLALFAKNNSQYMPGGGGNVNEILWGIAYDSQYTQTYGGTTFLVASEVSANLGMDYRRYGVSSPWTCLKARQNLSELFAPWNSKSGNVPNGQGSLYSDDARASQWIAGNVNFVDNGQESSQEVTIQNTEIGEWSNGYTVIKWTNIDANEDGSLNFLTDPDKATEFVSTDLALIRLADVYLMYVECYVREKASALPTNALKYMNYVRNRAKIEPYTSINQIDLPEVINERGRELYWEMTRRSDLIRFDMYTGNSYLWSWKGNVLEGTGIADRYKLMPIPTNIIAAQPSFNQNPGW